METPTRAGTQEPSGGPSTAHEPSQFGPPSPLEPLATAMELGRPVSRGFALALVAVVLAALTWTDHRQSVRLDAVESSVVSVTSSGAPVSDPQTCWLLGVVAGAQGRADLVSRLDPSAAGGDCQVYAARGARGQSLDGG